MFTIILLRFLSIIATDSSSIVGVIVGCLAVAIVIGILLAGASIILCLCVQKKHGLKTSMSVSDFVILIVVVSTCIL